MPTCYAVGVGPGDPELLTRKAERILRQADMILAPVSLPGDASVAHEIVREFVDESRQELIIHRFPMTSDRSILVPAWKDAASLIADRVSSGKNVAFITIGDPFLYSTFIYVMRILRENYPEVPVEIVPGISSINTAAAEAGISLAEADGKIAVIPATAGLQTIVEALDNYETVVLLKVKPLYREIIELLRKMGWTETAVFVERAGSPRRKILTDTAAMEQHTPDYLSLMIIKRT